MLDYFVLDNCDNELETKVEQPMINSALSCSISANSFVQNIVQHKMAASLSPSQRQEDFKEEFLTCSICTEPYDNDQHQAKCLPCLHTYCKSCLQKLAGKRSKINCPNCHSLVTLPGGTVDSLPGNFIVENLKDYRDAFNLAVLCGSCGEEGSQAVSFCHDCGCFICQTCVDGHRRMGALRGHKLSTMAELQQQKCNPMAQRHQQCKKHPKQDLILFCKEPNCKIPVCAPCGLIDHQGHDLTDLSAALDEVKADMQSSAASVSSRNQEIAKKHITIKTMQETLTDNFNQKEKDMRECKQKLINLINSQFTKANSHLKSLYQTEMNRLSSSIETLNCLSAQMTSACEFANQACDTSNPTQLLTSKKQIIERLSDLENKELPESESEKTGLTLTDQHRSAMAEMQKSVQHLFDTDWKRKAQNHGGKNHHNNYLFFSSYIKPYIGKRDQP